MDESLMADASSGSSEKPRIKVQLYKTEPCQNWSIYGTCRYGHLCKFAHGVCEQRSRLRHPKYKTSMCKDFPLGKCTFGDRCNFAHSPSELRVNMNPQSVAQASQPAQALIQTPLTVLPDGRTILTFTPVSGPGSPGNAKEVLRAAPLKSLRRVAGDLRRNQSMDTLRSGSHLPRGLTGKVSLASLKDISKVTLATIESSSVPYSSAAASAAAAPAAPAPAPAASPSIGSHQQLPLQASPPLTSPLLSARHTALQSNAPSIPLPAPPTDSSIQQLYYLQQQENDNVARRVASLSHLPTLKPSQSQTFGFSSNANASNNNSISSGSIYAQQGFLLGGNQTSSSFVSHMHTSTLAQIPSNQYSPALSSASFRDFDEAMTPGTQLDSASINSEWLRVHASQHQHQHQHQHPSPPQQQLLKSKQRKTLTSSISMQTLPRFKLPTNWEQPQQTVGGGNSLSSLSPSMSSTTNITHPSMSSQNSAATLIDSDVWSSPSYANYGIDQINSNNSNNDSSISNGNNNGSGGLLKPHESRFFPASHRASSGNILGSYYGARTHPHSQYQQQLRRQQSTDDWVSLRNNAYASPNNLASGGYALDVSVAGLNISNMKSSSDPRFGSADQMRSTATSARKQLNPSLYNSMLCL